MILTALTVAACTVTDGDTIRCGAERIRLEGIDAPELRARCPREAVLARKARARLGTLLSDGFTLQRAGKDRYGRTLATLRVNGRDVGGVLVREGLARVWTGRREGWCR